MSKSNSTSWIIVILATMGLGTFLVAVIVVVGFFFVSFQTATPLIVDRPPPSVGTHTIEGPMVFEEVTPSLTSDSSEIEFERLPVESDPEPRVPPTRLGWIRPDVEGRIEFSIKSPEPKRAELLSKMMLDAEMPVPQWQAARSISGIEGPTEFSERDMEEPPAPE